MCYFGTVRFSYQFLFYSVMTGSFLQLWMSGKKKDILTSVVHMIWKERGSQKANLHAEWPILQLWRALSMSRFFCSFYWIKWRGSDDVRDSAVLWMFSTAALWSFWCERMCALFENQNISFNLFFDKLLFFRLI